MKVPGSQWMERPVVFRAHMLPPLWGLRHALFPDVDWRSFGHACPRTGAERDRLVHAVGAPWFWVLSGDNTAPGAGPLRDSGMYVYRAGRLWVTWAPLAHYLKQHGLAPLKRLPPVPRPWPAPVPPDAPGKWWLARRLDIVRDLLGVG